MINGKKQVNRFVFLCSFIYFVSYVTRINYGAVLVEMCTALKQPESALSVALTGSFITYGAGQLVSGFLGDHIHPKKLLSIGLLATTLINLVLPFFTDPAMMAVLWCINGFAQSFMWPPLIKTMLMLLSMEDYEKKIVNVGYGSSGGTIFVYLVAPLCILISGWKLMFWLSGLMGAVGLLVWNRYCPDFTLTYPERKVQSSRNKKSGGLWSVLLLIAVICIFLQGVMRDGVTTYTPSFISDTYGLSNEISILTGVLLPIFSVLCTKACAKLHLKLVHNLLTFSFLLFGIGAASAVLLYFFSQAAVLSIVLLIIINACMHGVNLMLISYLPAKLADREHLSTMAGLTNSFAYVGSAVSTYVVPLAAESHGWSATLFVWAAVSILGTVFCLLGIPMYRKRMKATQQN